jgi:hypothetical protein
LGERTPRGGAHYDPLPGVFCVHKTKKYLRAPTNTDKIEGAF